MKSDLLEPPGFSREWCDPEVDACDPRLAGSGRGMEESGLGLPESGSGLEEFDLGRTHLPRDRRKFG